MRIDGNNWRVFYKRNHMGFIKFIMTELSLTTLIETKNKINK
jgi:hypothetical protein